MKGYVSMIILCRHESFMPESQWDCLNVALEKRLGQSHFYVGKTQQKERAL